MGVQHKLLRIGLAAGHALEGPVYAMDYSQVRDKSRHEVKLFVANLTRLFVALEFLTRNDIFNLDLEILFFAKLLVIIGPLAATYRSLIDKRTIQTSQSRLT